MKFNMKNGGFFIDLPYGRLHISRDSEGFGPYELMIASLAGCSGSILQTILEKMRLDIQDIQIEANAERNKKKANRIEKVSLHFKIMGTKLNKQKLTRAMELTKKNCGMVQSVLGSVDVEETFELIECQSG
ncbi:OsmC family protein [Siminovitchia sediminis]|uniref:OsmC family protein n=1 Tax=Siminovitchia sediminis TaxID=1274353 RepID=A0ABW4KLP9_9BACI